MDPTSINFETVQLERSYEITEVSHGRPLGYTEGDQQINANFVIQDKKLVITYPRNTLARVITEIFDYSIQKLTTQDKEFTKFKII